MVLLGEISLFLTLAKRINYIVLKTIRSWVMGIGHRHSAPLSANPGDDLAGEQNTSLVASAVAADSVRGLTEAGLLMLWLQASACMPDSWVTRRVEQLEFLDTRAVRWRVSIDFVVPEDAPLIADKTRLLPVTSVSKGGLVAFDMRDESGNAIWLPTSDWTSRRLSSALCFNASRLLNGALPESVNHDLSNVASNDGAGRRAALEVFAAAGAILDAEGRYQDSRAELTEASRHLQLPCRLGEIRKRWARQRRWNCAQDELARADLILRRAKQRWHAVPPSDTRSIARRLMGDVLFRSQLGELAHNLVILAPVASAPGTRRIIKLSSESPISFQRPRGRIRRLWQSLGWRCWPVEVLIGGRGGSHHLEVAAPPGVDIVSICAKPLDRRSTEDSVYAGGGTPHVHIRLPANGVRYRARILLRVARPGWLTVSWLTVVVIAGAMVAGRFKLAALYSTSTAAGTGAGTTATLILTLLGVIATASVRPQPLASRLLLLARSLIVVDVTAALIATGALAFHQGAHAPSALWTVLAAVTTTVAAMFTLSLLLPITRTRRP